MVSNQKNVNAGFTLIELMIVVIIIGILASIFYPSYQRYVIKTNRSTMMTDLQNIGSQIQSQKLAKGSYTNVDTSSLVGDYPQQSTPKLYNVTATLDANGDKVLGDWIITATPKPNTIIATDGVLTLNFDGIKCRSTVCGKTNEWNQ